MKKSFLVLFVVILLMLVSLNVSAKDKTSSERSLSNLITIKEGDKNLKISENANIVLDNYMFDICIDNIIPDDAVYLFAYYNTDFMNKYQFPVNKDETEIFCTGSALAEYDLDPGKGYSLSINEPFTFHYVYKTRRINKSNSCIIPVRKLTDPTGKFAGKICFSFFVDYNNNNIIEENEYAAFEISLSPSVTFNANDFSEENRAYLSALGYTVKKENFHNKNYQVYKITSEKDFEKFIKATRSNFSGKKPKDYFQHYFDQKNMTTNDAYLLMIPDNMSFANNPFKILGNNALFFEVVETPKGKDSVSLKIINKEKNEADFEISFYINGEIIPAVIKSF